MVRIKETDKVILSKELSWIISFWLGDNYGSREGTRFMKNSNTYSTVKLVLRNLASSGLVKRKREKNNRDYFYYL